MVQVCQVRHQIVLHLSPKVNKLIQVRDHILGLHHQALLRFLWLQLVVGGDLIQEQAVVVENFAIKIILALRQGVPIQLWLAIQVQQQAVGHTLHQAHLIQQLLLQTVVNRQRLVLKLE
jgi:hypothetical protein